MLFFVRSELKGMPPLSPKQWLEFVIKGMEMEIDYQKQGKILAQGDFAGEKGGCAIYDVESNEELHKLLGQIPAHAFLDFDVVPLVAREYNLQFIKQVQASMPDTKN
jgi:muconolactone D-isomerase